jgi:hypothetical protein
MSLHTKAHSTSTITLIEITIDANSVQAYSFLLNISL